MNFRLKRAISLRDRSFVMSFNYKDIFLNEGHSKGAINIKLVIDNNVVEKYNQYYFSQHPKAKKKAIEHSYHPSINVWMVLPRIQMNALKQKWKDFIIYWINDLGLQNKHLEKFEMTFTTYMPTKRRIDCDNTVPKFILDGFSESGFIVDDDGSHLKSLTLKTGYDKDNPRTEIEVIEV